MSILRWPLADDNQGEQELFPQGLRVVGKGEYRGLEFLEVDSKTIINKVPGPPRFGFSYTINAYRGCSHRCSYCFARPTHEYLGLDIDADFDSKIVVKRNAVDLARAETAPSRWGGDLVAMGTNTDPYQAAEGKYRLTRGVLQVMVERANPVSILTKSSLVLRDSDVLAALASRTAVRVDFSVGTVDQAVAAATEPGASHPQRRLDAVARLNDAGIPSGVLLGPILPGISDGVEQLRAAISGAVAAGAVSIGHVALHLGPGIKQHYMSWLAGYRPELLVMYRELYGGKGKQAAASYRSSLAATFRRLLVELGAPPPAARPMAVSATAAAPAVTPPHGQLALELGASHS